MKSQNICYLLGLLLLLGGCSNENPTYTGGPVDRGAIALKNDWYGDSANEIVYLPQNWSAEESLWFYYTTQGSELLPYDIFVNLEQQEGDALFIEPKHMAKFRYLPQRPTKDNPDGLPVGFVRNGPYVGLTCAACHTNQINYQGTGMRVDGAPAQSNMVAFLQALEAAMRETYRQPEKFKRFKKRLLGTHESEENSAEVKAWLSKAVNEVANYNTRNQSGTEYGHARVDAVGRIYNQVIQFTSGGDFSLEPNAPVSYPFLWDTPQHDWVQWVGLTSNANFGSLGRNSGEVIGVFGKVEVVKHTNIIEQIEGYRSTVEAMNLTEMEESVRKLQSPQWPVAVLPEVDGAKAHRGQKLYAQHCASCHHLLDRNDPKRMVRAQMYDIKIVKTDPTEINNALQSAPTGILEGALMPNGVSAKFGKEAPVALMLGDLVEGVLARNKEAAIKAAVDAEEGGNGEKSLPKEGKHAEDTTANPFASLASYKARPLDGIWATAPYLHNGSVPTLYDLLLPAAQRPEAFAVGQLEFDPVKVGFRSDVNPEAPFIYRVKDKQGHPITGNSNAGHEFATDLADEDRWALVEYLKTL